MCRYQRVPDGDREKSDRVWEMKSITGGGGGGVWGPARRRGWLGSWEGELGIFSSIAPVSLRSYPIEGSGRRVANSKTGRTLTGRTGTIGGLAGGMFGYGKRGRGGAWGSMQEVMTQQQMPNIPATLLWWSREVGQ